MIDDEKLMAYADGELDLAARVEVEAAMAADPTLRDRVEAHRRVRAAVSGTYAGAADEPVPARLSAMIGKSVEVIDIAAARTRKVPPARPVWQSWGAIAATLLVGVIAGRMIDAGPPPEIAARDGVLMAQGALAERLDTQLASAGAGLGLSFRNRNGDYCRTFRADALAGIACRDKNGWGVRVAVAAAPSASNYRMAGSDMPMAVIEAVEDIIAGEPLNEAEEAAARNKDWRD